MDLTIAGISSLMVFITCWVTRNSSELIWVSSGLHKNNLNFLHFIGQNIWVSSRLHEKIISILYISLDKIYESPQVWKNQFKFCTFHWTRKFKWNSFKLMWGSLNAYFVDTFWYIEPVFRIWSHNFLTDFIFVGSPTKHVHLPCRPLPFLPLTLAHRGLDMRRLRPGHWTRL